MFVENALTVHDLEFAPTLQVILEETLPELQRMKDEGKVGAIGKHVSDLGELLVLFLSHF